MSINNFGRIIDIAVKEAANAERERILIELTRQGVIWKDNFGNWTHVQPLKPENYKIRLIQNIE
jgi:hypothetical protein